MKNMLKILFLAFICIIVSNNSLQASDPREKARSLINEALHTCSSEGDLHIILEGHLRMLAELRGTSDDMKSQYGNYCNEGIPFSDDDLTKMLDGLLTFCEKRLAIDPSIEPEDENPQY